MAARRRRLALDILLVFFATSAIIETGASDFTAAFFFGDSTLDTGNNPLLRRVLFQSNHAPYGCDFPGGPRPTGRFSNGLLVPDLVSSALGLKRRLSPPFLDPNLPDSEIATGVTFASAGSGYDEATSSSISRTLPMSRQAAIFGSNYTRRLRAAVGGAAEADRIIRGAVAFACSGSNDIIKKFPKPSGGALRQYHDLLIHKVQIFIMELYSYGLRKFVVAGLPPVGCSPIHITLQCKGCLLRQRRCDDAENDDAAAYNAKLVEMLPRLQRTLAGSRIVYFDIFDQSIELLRRASQLGFEVTKKGCCGTGLLEVGPFCFAALTKCSHRSSYIFFDSIHPTERVYRLFADHIMQNIIPQFN